MADKPTVYIETTVVSYLTAWPSRDVIRLSHEMLTRQWWQSSRPHFDLFTSDFVIAEASAGDPTAAAERLAALGGIPLLAPNESVDRLAEQLATALALPPRARMDAAHVAIAAVHGMKFLLTWNCTHLANGELADRIERVCADTGLSGPRILTPEMLMVSP
jgi:hypothetical protein